MRPGRDLPPGEPSAGLKAIIVKFGSRSQRQVVTGTGGSPAIVVTGTGESRQASPWISKARVASWPAHLLPTYQPQRSGRRLISDSSSQWIVVIGRPKLSVTS